MSEDVQTYQISRNKLQIGRFRVTVVRGVDTAASAVSGGVELTIGTAEGNDLRLSDPAVSRHHCALAVTREGVAVRDLDSTNGTLLAGCRVTSALLVAGATIGVGHTLIRFEPLPESIDEPVSREDRFGPVLGRSKAMRRLFAIALRIAPSEATVLLEGETGTGKSLFAEAIHEASARAPGPFVVIDCATIPPQLVESELFGHEAGAFTGARQTRIGLFESAQGGTVFLDEVGELPIEVQPKLLRVLERREIRRVGSHQPIPVDARIVAATNRDLRREVNRGAFRSDLWYRLNTVRLVVPPLRERREDIPLLVAHFLQQLGEAGRPQADMIAELQRGEWRGNVRELASAVERWIVLDDPDRWRQATPEIDAAGAWAFDPELSFRASKLRVTETWERQYLQQLVGYHQGNLSAASRAARMDRSHLRSLLRRYGIEVSDLSG